MGMGESTEGYVRVDKDLEGGVEGLFEATALTFVWRD
jgi:hypothetical protein